MRHGTGDTTKALKRQLAGTLIAASLCLGQAPARAEPTGESAILPNRWFFSFGYGRTRGDVDRIKELIDTAADHGLNGMVLSSFGLDGITRWSDRDLALLQEIAASCAKRQIELIPTGFSVGYGGGALGHSRSFAAALPVTLRLRERDGRIVPVPGENRLRNGDLEQHTDNRFSGFAFHDQPGEVSFADRGAGYADTSIRFENFGANPHGHGRIMQKVTVTPGRAYRFSYRLKTRNLVPASGLKAMVLAEGRSLASATPSVKPTQDWTTCTLDFISHDEHEVYVYAGIWQGASGQFWLDDLRFAERGDLSDIVRREGAPLSLRSRDRNQVFIEGTDFGAIDCLRQLESLPLPPGSGIRKGENLALSCFRIPSVSHAWGQQISLCMSNPELYPYWASQAEKLYQTVPFKRILLSMDEIRNGGGCRACRDRNKTMAEILGDCVTRQQAIFRAIHPEIDVLIWSDMLDPAHNAHKDYYGVVGDFTGSWRYVPRDLTIMCWNHQIRDQSLTFFARKGFRTMGAAYYDAEDLANPRDWFLSLQATPTATGIMYTTWQKRYRLLGAFGDLMSADSAGPGED